MKEGWRIVSAQIPEALAKELEMEARRTYRTVSAVLHMLIARWVEERQKGSGDD